MLQRKTLVRSVIAFALAVLLNGCGGLEKGPAPDLPYTPEPPRPKAASKKDAPGKLGPSLPVPIKVELPGKKDEEAKKAPTPDTSQAPAPAAGDEKKDPAEKKDEPAKDATQSTKDTDEPKKD